MPGLEDRVAALEAWKTAHDEAMHLVVTGFEYWLGVKSPHLTDPANPPMTRLKNHLAFLRAYKDDNSSSPPTP